MRRIEVNQKRGIKLSDLTTEEYAKYIESMNKKLNDKSRREAVNNTIVYESRDNNTIITAEVPNDVEVEIIEETVGETEAEFGRRVRFHIKVTEYRARAERLREKEANKHWILKACDKAKDNASKAVDAFIEYLER